MEPFIDPFTTDLPAIDIDLPLIEQGGEVPKRMVAGTCSPKVIVVYPPR